MSTHKTEESWLQMGRWVVNIATTLAAFGISLTPAKLGVNCWYVCLNPAQIAAHGQRRIRWSHLQYPGILLRRHDAA